MPISPAAIAIVHDKDLQKILLVKRRDVPVWVLPGGGIDSGETPEEAVIREVKEETGLHIAVERLAAHYSPVNRLSAPTFVFICRILNGHLTTSLETQEVAFFSPTEASTLLFPLHFSWLQECLAAKECIKRELKEVSYFSLLHYFLCHPWQVVRYGWTRIFS